jgi:ribonuclease P protein component
VDRARSLRKGKEFDRVYREGTVVSGPFFVLRVLAEGEGQAKWGFAVGKRLDRRAVVRNRVRRRLREAARLSGAGSGFAAILTARPRVLEATFPEIRESLGRALRKAGLLDGQG